MEVERWAKSTAGPDWTISLGWGTFSTVVSSFLATPKTILEPSRVVHPRLEPFHRGKNIFTVEQGGAPWNGPYGTARLHDVGIVSCDSEFVLTNGHSDCSIVVLRGQDPAMFLRRNFAARFFDYSRNMNHKGSLLLKSYRLDDNA